MFLPFSWEERNGLQAAQPSLASVLRLLLPAAGSADCLSRLSGERLISDAHSTQRTEGEEEGMLKFSPSFFLLLRTVFFSFFFSERRRETDRD